MACIVFRVSIPYTIVSFCYALLYLLLMRISNYYCPKQLTQEFYQLKQLFISPFAGRAVSFSDLSHKGPDCHPGATQQ